MKGIFDLDNVFFRTLGKGMDCIILSLLWFISCIPVFTVGAATCGLYYAVNKVIMHNRSYIWTEYWHGFRSNFKQGTIAWLIIFAAACFLGIDIFVMKQFYDLGEKVGAIYPVFYVFLAVLIVWANYIFAYIPRFEDSLKKVFRNSLVFSILNLIWSIVTLLLFLFVCYIIYLLPELIIILPAAYTICLNEMVERIFVKYMSKEDLEAEKERNQEYQ